MNTELIRYNIFHSERSVNRRISVLKNKALFNKYKIKSLECETQDFTTFEVMNDFIKNNPKFKIRTHNEYPAIFPHVSGVIGVWASSWVSYKALLESDAEFAILLEDDTILKEEFFKALPAMIENLPSDCDVMSFCIPDGELHRFIVSNHYIGNPLISKLYQASWAGGYIVTRSGAEKIMSWVDNHMIDIPIDWFLFTDFGIVNVYNILPYIEKLVDVDPDNVDSYIGKTEGNPNE
jgi:hypothetical protein